MCVCVYIYIYIYIHIYIYIYIYIDIHTHTHTSENTKIPRTICIELAAPNQNKIRCEAAARTSGRLNKIVIYDIV